jgi:high-affinity Fe2+/Pb2+ permease
MQPRPETVEALLESVRDFLQTEDTREQSVNTRAGGVVVFGGVILSLLASLGRDVLAIDLPDGLDETSLGCFVLAVASLLTSISMTLFGVLFPQQSASIAMEEIEQYGDLETLAQERIQVQGETLEGLIRVLAIDRDRISSKTRWLRHAYSALVVGLFAAGVLGVILALHESGIS